MHISIGLGDYDIHQGLFTGAVKVAGCDTIALPVDPSPTRFWRFLSNREFDACELSLGSYLAGFQNGEYTAVPAFPHRRFRHHYYFVRTGAGIAHPKDLEGKTVGLRTWQTTAGLWMRGILSSEYGVDLTRIHWVKQSHEDVEDIHPPVPLDVVGDDLEQLLLGGQIDALLYPEMLPSFRKKDPRVARLFPDARAEEVRYFENTGIFPIMHVLAIRRELAEQHPWLPRNLMLAWNESKDLAMQRLKNPRSVSVAWLTPTLEAEWDLLGPDPWQIGLTEYNRRALATAIGYARDQGLLAVDVVPEELFWPAALGEASYLIGG